MTVEFKSNLRLIAADIQQELAAALGETAADIGTLAEQLSPVDTGALKASKRVAPQGDDWVVSFGEGLPDARAVYQEYGTSRSPAQPFLTPAVESIDPTFRAKARIAALIAKHQI